jgi:NAD(P)-dependent dehydrogenase (short-subunit alcohol dehydrogenase family)
MSLICIIKQYYNILWVNQSNVLWSGLMTNVFITGANRGLGLEFVKQYLTLGHYVYAACRDPKQAKELHQIQDKNLEILKLDVSSTKDLQAIKSKLGNRPIDILINNAGIWRGSEVGSINEKDWLHSFAVNTIAPIKIAEGLLDNIKSGHLKKIISITSKMGSIDDNTSGGSYIYRSSKSALNSAMQSLRHDLSSHDIATLTLHPGWVRTDMGGPGGWIDVEESVGGMIRVINNLNLKNSGQYLDYAGKLINW